MRGTNIPISEPSVFSSDWYEGYLAMFLKKIGTATRRPKFISVVEIDSSKSKKSFTASIFEIIAELVTIQKKNIKPASSLSSSLLS